MLLIGMQICCNLYSESEKKDLRYIKNRERSFRESSEIFIDTIHQRGISAFFHVLPIFKRLIYILIYTSSFRISIRFNNSFTGDSFLFLYKLCSSLTLLMGREKCDSRIIKVGKWIIFVLFLFYIVCFFFVI